MFCVACLVRIVKITDCIKLHSIPIDFIILPVQQ